jgi:methyl coenzyme M reductase subunit C
MIKTSLFAHKEREAKLKQVMRCRGWISMSTSPPLLQRSTLHHCPQPRAAAVRLSPPN